MTKRGTQTWRHHVTSTLQFQLDELEKHESQEAKRKLGWRGN